MRILCNAKWQYKKINRPIKTNPAYTKHSAFDWRCYAKRWLVVSIKVKRKLHIGDEVYYWVADQNKLELYPYKEMHIRVHKDNDTKSILYIDANAWHFEISPQNIKEAIKFALSNGWDPKVAGKSLYIAMNEKGFYVLPKGIVHELETY